MNNKTKKYDLKSKINVGVRSFLAFILGKGISIPTNIIIINILGIYDYSILVIINMIIQYLSFIHLGFLLNLNREVPIAYGKQDIKEVNRLHSTILTNYGLTTILGLLILLILYIFGFNFDNKILFIHIVFIFLIKLATYFESFLNSYAKGDGEFKTISDYQLFSKISFPLINLIFVYFHGLEGILFSMALTPFIGSIFLWLKLNKPFIKYKFDKNHSFKLLKTSYLMQLNKILDGVLISTGVLFASLFLNPYEIAIIGFTILIANTAKAPFTNVYTMFANREINIIGGQEGIHNLEKLKVYFGKNMTVYFMISILFNGAMVLTYFFIINFFLNEFIESKKLLIILFLGVNFYNLRILIYSYLNLTLQMKKRLLSTLLGVFLNITLCFLSVIMKYDLIGIIFSTSLSLILVSTNVLFLSINQIFKDKTFTLVYFSKFILVSIISLVIIFIFKNYDFTIYNSNLYEFFNIMLGIMDLIIKLIIFTLINTLIFILLFKKYRIYNDILEFFIILFKFRIFKNR